MIYVCLPVGIFSLLLTQVCLQRFTTISTIGLAFVQKINLAFCFLKIQKLNLYLMLVISFNYNINIHVILVINYTPGWAFQVLNEMIC